MIDLIFKIFITYAAISMFSGGVYAFSFMSELIPFKYMNIGIFAILWLGPLMLGVAIGCPVMLYKLWNG